MMQKSLFSARLIALAAALLQESGLEVKVFRRMARQRVQRGLLKGHICLLLLLLLLIGHSATVQVQNDAGAHLSVYGLVANHSLKQCSSSQCLDTCCIGLCLVMHGHVLSGEGPADCSQVDSEDFSC